jgi:hypothetical protein
MEELFCGSTNGYPLVAFTPKSKVWDSEKLIGHLDRSKIRLTPAIIHQNKETFWDNLASEYDAENFCRFLQDEGFLMSLEFKAFEFVWRRDEYNHYLGFRHIYSTLYEIDKNTLTKDLKAKPINFSPIKTLLEDEFKVCLLLAYDELATTKSYAGDYAFYASFGHPNFLQWIKWVTRDEAYHFNNCMEIIGKNHYHRIGEISLLVDQFIEWDLARNEYQGTFVLDHANYDEDFLLSCGRIMKRYFG